MKTNTIKRILSTIGILIFFLPFFQMCSDKSLKEKPAFFRNQLDSQSESDKKAHFEQSKENVTFTGYDLALNYEVPLFLIFTGIMFLNFIIWVFTLRNFEIGFLVFLNTLLSIIALSALCFIIPFGQLRYGIFLFQINSLLLCYVVFKKD